MKDKLNIGCGTDIKTDYLNLDIAKINGVDVVHDINSPLPFDNDSFNEVLCLDILEHTNDVGKVLKEIHRVLKDDGQVKIKVPHFTAALNYIDLTHKHLFSCRTFEFFINGTKYHDKRSYYYDFVFSDDFRTKITFNKHPYIYNYVVEPIVNLNKYTQYFYEDTFLSRLFPASSLYIELNKGDDI